jgi:hypothetical protein
VDLRVDLDAVQARNISFPCRESNPAFQPVARRYSDLKLIFRRLNPQGEFYRHTFNSRQGKSEICFFAYVNRTQRRHMDKYRYRLTTHLSHLKNSLILNNIRKFSS